MILRNCAMAMKTLTLLPLDHLAYELTELSAQYTDSKYSLMFCSKFRIGASDQTCVRPVERDQHPLHPVNEITTLIVACPASKNLSNVFRRIFEYFSELCSAIFK